MTQEKQNLTRRQILALILGAGAAIGTTGVACYLARENKTTQIPTTLEDIQHEKEMKFLRKRNKQEKQKNKEQLQEKKLDATLSEKEYLPNTRGVRNKNPGNIKYNSTNKWEGQIGHDGPFCVFKSHEHGLRAMSILLKNYEKKYGFNTIEELANKWAPKTENNTKEYINFISTKTGYNPNQNLNLNDKTVTMKLIQAKCKRESGADYSLERISKALDL